MLGWIGVLPWFWVVLVWWRVTQQVSLYSFFGFLQLVRGRIEHINNQVPEIKSWNLTHAQTCIKRDNLGFRWAVCGWCLFSCTSNLLERMYDFQICTKVHPRTILILQDLRQNQSPETILSTMLCRTTHMAILYVITRVMNARDQTYWTFVASSGPLGDST